jgi:hypothetical protein
MAKHLRVVVAVVCAGIVAVAGGVGLKWHGPSGSGHRVAGWTWDERPRHK